MSNLSARVLLVLVMACTVPPLAHAQYGGGMGGIGGGTPGIGMVPGTPYGGAMDPSQVTVQEGWLVVPSISGAQRYDSNVYFSPKTPGLDRSDYVTTAVPQLRTLYAGSAFKLNATIGAVSEYYAVNNGLSYVGANGGLSLDLSPALDRLWKGMTFRVNDFFAYTPQPPSFLTGDLEGDSSNPYTRGLQVGRVNTTTNSVNANFSAPVSSSVSVTGSYTYSFLRFGSSATQQVGFLFDTDTRMLSTGVLYNISVRDAVGVNYVDSQTDYKPSSVGSFSSRGGTAVWNHAFTPTLTMMTTAGAQVLEGNTVVPQTTAQSTLTNVAVPPTVVPSGGVTLMAKERTSSWTVNYTTMVAPSFLVASVPLLTHTVTLAATQQVWIPELTAVGSVNYARGDPYGSSSGNGQAQSFRYQSFGGTGGVIYKATPKSFLSLTYSYMKFDQTFQAQSFIFTRNVVSLGFTQAFY